MKHTCRYATKYSNTAFLNQPVATGNSNNCTIVHLISTGITWVVCQVFEFAARALLVLRLSFTVLSTYVLNSGELVEGGCQCCGWCVKTIVEA